MDGKIGLEEHFAHPNTLADAEVYFTADVWPEMRKRLLDVAEVRLRQMDQYGMEYMIISLNSPAIQAITDKGRALDVARRANSWPPRGRASVPYLADRPPPPNRATRAASDAAILS